MPLKAGITLRRILYHQLFAKLGESPTILVNAEFSGANRIEIGDHILIDRGARISCNEHHGRIVIGNHVRIGQGVELYCYGKNYFEIGDGTHINSYTRLSGSGVIKIGKDCLIAPHVGIYSSNHKYSDPTIPIKNQGSTAKGIVIGDDCWLGAGVTVLDGVRIGTGSVIGAGAVVTKNIPPYSIAVGVPAKVVAQRGEYQPLDTTEGRGWINGIIPHELHQELSS